MILSLIAGAALAVPAVQDPQPDDATQELVGLARGMAAAESYTFTSTAENSGGGFGGRGGFGGGGGRPGGEPGGRPGGGPGGDAGGDAPAQPPPPSTIEGGYHTGLPMRLVLGDRIAFKEAETLVYRNAEGAWEALEVGGGGRGGFGGGPGGPGAGADSGVDRTAMMALFQLRRVDSPHTLFADFEGKLKSVAKEVVQLESDVPNAKLEQHVYTGELSESGVQSLGGGFGRGGRGGFGGGPGGGGPGGPPGGPPAGGGGGEGGDATPERPRPESSGTFVIEVVSGVITSATFETKRTMTFRDQTVDRTTKRTLTFAKLGETEYEVPDDALAHFEI